MRTTAITTALTCLTLLASPAAWAEEAPPYDGSVSTEGVISDRYGHRLKAYFHFPANEGERAPGRFPVILAMNYLSPNPAVGSSDQTAFAGDADPLPGEGKYYARRGYAYVTVDFPARGSSTGWNVIDRDGTGRSGHDVVEWLAKQPWSTGKVGMTGRSGNGLVQLWTALQRPQHLVTIVPEVAPWDLYRDLFYPGGMRASTTYVSVAATFNATGLPCQDIPTTRDQLEDALYCLRRRAQTSTLVPLDMVDVQQHPDFDNYWQSKVVDLSKIDIPIWTLGSWDDFFTESSTDLFRDTASRHKLLAMGTGGHTIRKSLDTLPELLAWFDHWLKGERNDVAAQLRDTRFRYLLQGEGRWHAADSYPIPQTRYTPLYLSGDGLRADGPPERAGSAEYVYQPLQGASSGQYGTLRLTDPNGIGGAAPNELNPADPTSPADQRIEEPQTLQFVGEELEEDTEVTGPITISFYASSTASDTDWVVHLLDVRPDGYRFKVTTGWLSGTHRDSLVRPEPVPVGEVVKYTIELYPTSQLFRKGHRIGVAIASGDLAHTFPNPNPARNTVFFGPHHPSHITLPVIPAGATRPDERSRFPR